MGRLGSGLYYGHMLQVNMKMKMCLCVCKAMKVKLYDAVEQAPSADSWLH